MRNWGCGYGRLTLAHIVLGPLGTERHQVEGRKEALDRLAVADVVYRPGTPRKAMVAEVERVVRWLKECQHLSVVGRTGAGRPIEATQDDLGALPVASGLLRGRGAPSLCPRKRSTWSSDASANRQA